MHVAGVQFASDSLAATTKVEDAVAAESQGFYFLALNEALTLLLEEGRAPGWKRARSSRAALVAQTTSPPHFFAKIFFPRRWHEGVKTLFRGDRAYRTDWRTHALRAAGFAAPAVVLRGRVQGLPYVITPALPGISLADYLDRPRVVALTAAGQIRQRRRVLNALGAEIARLHQAGFFHTELRTSNIHVHLQPDGTPRFFFLDNEGTRRFMQLPWRRRVKNLAQLNMDHRHVSRTDRLRVLRAYVKAAGLEPGLGPLAREIHQRTQRRRRENALRAIPPHAPASPPAATRFPTQTKQAQKPHHRFESGPPRRG